MRYYEVKVKCGHVGKNNYYVGTIYCYGENGREAAQFARTCGRVKHDRKDAILSVKEVTYEQYIEGKKQVRKTAYWKCGNVQQQRQKCPELYEAVFKEQDTETQHTKKHSLKNSRNGADPLYSEFSGYRGDILLEMLCC